MYVSREFLEDLGCPAPAIDRLKYSQAERDKLCVVMLLPVGTVLLDAQWRGPMTGIDQMGFLVSNPEFPETKEGEKLPTVCACYVRQLPKDKPEFTCWQFSKTWGVLLEQCEWFRSIPKHKPEPVPKYDGPYGP